MFVVAKAKGTQKRPFCFGALCLNCGKSFNIKHIQRKTY